MSKEKLIKDIEAFGIDFEGRVSNIQKFMERLLRSGVDPSYVSLEGYRYTEILVDALAFNIPSKTLKKEISAILLEESATRVGIHVDQLEAKMKECSTLLSGKPSIDLSEKEAKLDAITQ